jgi:5'-3' exonuclease
VKKKETPAAAVSKEQRENTINSPLCSDKCVVVSNEPRDWLCGCRTVAASQLPFFNPPHPFLNTTFSFIVYLYLLIQVGNDFLPHLPSLDIAEGAFDRLFTTYKEQMLEAATAARELGGGGGGGGKTTTTTNAQGVAGAYLTSSGSVPDLARLERFLAAIGRMEDEIFKERAATEKEFQDRMQRRNRRDGGGGGDQVSEAEKEQVEAERRANFQAALTAADGGGGGSKGGNGSGNGGNGGSNSSSGFEYQKGLYYFEKLGITPSHVSVHEAIRLHYLEGLLWCLAYYYRGCISWGWFYPFHYGPMMSDMIGLSELGTKMRFEKGTPFLPFQLLLGCLPAASMQFLPKPYQFLMSDPESPIIDFYPKDFKVKHEIKRMKVRM